MIPREAGLLFENSFVSTCGATMERGTRLEGEDEETKQNEYCALVRVLSLQAYFESVSIYCRLAGAADLSNPLRQRALFQGP